MMALSVELTDLAASGHIVAELQRCVFCDMPEQIWGEEFVRSLASDPAIVCHIALERSSGATAPCGFVAARIVADEAEILSLGVLPELRRQSVASELLRWIIRLLASHGVRMLFLEVADNNEAGLRLYEKFRFQTVGRRPRYYVRRDGQRIDGLVMRLDLEG